MPPYMLVDRGCAKKYLTNLGKNGKIPPPYMGAASIVSKDYKNE